MALSFISPLARAQVNTDVGASAGGGVRLRSATPEPVAGMAGVELHGHLAMVPLVRVGAYAGYQETLPNGSEGRQYYPFGLDAKVASPWMRAPWRAWAFVGVGAAYVVASRQPASQGVSDAATLGPSSSQVTGVLLEVPVGVGAGLRIHSSWELDAVLSVRTAVASAGPVSRPSPWSDTQSFAGHEVLAVSLSVGVSFGR